MKDGGWFHKPQRHGAPRSAGSRRCPALARWIRALLVTVFPALNAAENHGDLLLFPVLSDSQRFSRESGSNVPENFINPGIDLFYTLDGDRFRLLAEWLVDRTAQEVQRLQVGWRWQDTTFWLGRTHNPIGFWNTRFHHGDYLITSISRPGIMSYETSGGPLPMHITGLYAEGSYDLGESSFYYVLNAGVGPNLRKHRLDAFDVLDPEGDRGPAVTLRLGYQPTSFAENEFGASFSFTKIPGGKIGVGDVDQTIVSAYANWRSEPFAFLGETFFIHNEYVGGQPQPQGNVASLYGQSEWRALDDLYR